MMMMMMMRINNTMLRVREARFGTLALWLERSRHEEARRG